MGGAGGLVVWPGLWSLRDTTGAGAPAFCEVTSCVQGEEGSRRGGTVADGVRWCKGYYTLLYEIIFTKGVKIFKMQKAVYPSAW
jgi:hypothetical protein